MSETVKASFEVKYLQVIDEAGNADPSLMPPLSDDELKMFFEKMVLVRTFNTRSLSLQREGRIGTYPSIHGQEASQIGSALAIGKDDWVFPSFRETGVLVTLGYPMWMLLRYWLGDERGAKCPEDLNIFPMSVPVGSHIPHVTGAAMAMNYRGHKKVAVGYFGDGGSSRGDFHEGLNLAGVFNAPAVFICQNNQWAISCPRKSQTAAETIAQRAFSYGFPGVQVDGNDIMAVYKATKEAVERARGGGGPTFIECVTYRLHNHTTADDASKYRSKEEVEEWEKKEPLIRMRLFMKKKGLWSEEYEKEITKKAEAEVDADIAKEESFRPSEPGDIMRFTNAEQSPRQLKEMKELGWLK
ncbi:MAG: pyruvate dehydrogenase (acetyl-transferring) E1 component subunit alpha [Thermodesulfobacteriota bacterium]